MEIYGYQKRVITIPNIFAQLYGFYQKTKNKLYGMEAGLDYSKLIGDLQSKFTYIDEEITVKTALELDLNRGNVRDAMKDTFIHC
jgi:hypothetical protein